MPRVRSPRSVLACGAVTAGLVGLIGLAGCSTVADSDPEEPVGGTPSTSAAATGTAPVVFAFVCRTGNGTATQTYTTYAAVWQDERTDCSAERLTGTQLSEQQRTAVAAAAGDATLEGLAAGCAVVGVGAWAEPIDSASQAHVAAGLARYCPGHPQIDHLRDALAAYRG